MPASKKLKTVATANQHKIIDFKVRSISNHRMPGRVWMTKTPQKNEISNHDGFKSFPGDKYCSLVQDLIFFLQLQVRKKKSLKSQGKHIETWTKTFNIKPILMKKKWLMITIKCLISFNYVVKIPPTDARGCNF